MIRQNPPIQSLVQPRGAARADLPRDATIPLPRSKTPPSMARRQSRWSISHRTVVAKFNDATITRPTNSGSKP